MRSVDLLRSVDIFAQLAEDDLQKIAGLLKEKRVKRDSIVLRQGEPADALCFVLEGRIKGTAVDSLGREREVAVLAEGQYFGEMALVTGEASIVTMQAVTDVKLLMLQKGDFDDFQALNVHVMLQTMKVVAQRQASGSLRLSVEQISSSSPPAAEQTITSPPPAAEQTITSPPPAAEQTITSSPPAAEQTITSPPPAAEQTITTPPPSVEQAVTSGSTAPTGEWHGVLSSAEPAVEEPTATGKVFTVFSPKGGVGKTTVAVNLAVALAHSFHDSVALLDLSLTFSHSSLLLNLAPRSSLSATTAESLRGMDPREELDYYLSIHPSSGLRLMMGALRPEDGETVTGDMTRVAIDRLRRRFAYVVIDTESYFSDPVLAALESSDRILLLSSPEIATLRGLRECLRIFKEVVFIPRDRLCSVMNYIFPFKVLSKEQFEETLQQELFAELPHSGDGPAKASLRGEALLDVQPGSSLARSIQKLAVQLVSEVDGTGASSVARQERRQGFFR